jgi:hypothetical protein
MYASVEVGCVLDFDDYGDTCDLNPGSSGKPQKTLEAGEIHPDVHSVACLPMPADVVFAPAGGGFFVSGDGGKTWTQKYPAYCGLSGWTHQPQTI